MKLLIRSFLLVLGLSLNFSTFAAPTIPNPSFETDHYTLSPGYASGNGGTITGWTISNPGSIGLNINGMINPGLFADNGLIPDGARMLPSSRVLASPIHFPPPSPIWLPARLIRWRFAPIHVRGMVSPTRHGHCMAVPAWRSPVIRPWVRGALITSTAPPLPPRAPPPRSRCKTIPPETPPWSWIISRSILWLWSPRLMTAARAHCAMPWPVRWTAP